MEAWGLGFEAEGSGFYGFWLRGLRLWVEGLGELRLLRSGGKAPCAERHVVSSHSLSPMSVYPGKIAVGRLLFAELRTSPKFGDLEPEVDMKYILAR